MTNEEHNELGDCATSLSIVAERLRNLAENIHDLKLSAAIVLAASFATVAEQHATIALCDGALLIDHA